MKLVTRNKKQKKTIKALRRAKTLWVVSKYDGIEPVIVKLTNFTVSLAKFADQTDFPNDIIIPDRSVDYESNSHLNYNNIYLADYSAAGYGYTNVWKPNRIFLTAQAAVRFANSKLPNTIFTQIAGKDEFYCQPN